MIVPIGEWVLREVCAQIKIWRKAGASAQGGDQSFSEPVSPSESGGDVRTSAFGF